MSSKRTFVVLDPGKIDGCNWIVKEVGGGAQEFFMTVFEYGP
jgi:hypothetical protein